MIDEELEELDECFEYGGFAVGDVVVCLPGFERNDATNVGGGWGYSEGKVFEIGRFHNGGDLGCFVTGKGIEEGRIWTHAIKKVDQDPYQSALVKMKKEIGLDVTTGN